MIEWKQLVKNFILGIFIWYQFVKFSFESVPLYGWACLAVSCTSYAHAHPYIQLWQASDGALLGMFKGHRRGVWSVKFSPIDQVSVLNPTPHTQYCLYLPPLPPPVSVCGHRLWWWYTKAVGRGRLHLCQDIWRTQQLSAKGHLPHTRHAAGIMVYALHHNDIIVYCVVCMQW